MVSEIIKPPEHDIEIIKPDPLCLEILKIIVETNAMIAGGLSPPMVITKLNKED